MIYIYIFLISNSYDIMKLENLETLFGHKISCIINLKVYFSITQKYLKTFGIIESHNGL